MMAVGRLLRGGIHNECDKNGSVWAIAAMVWQADTRVGSIEGLPQRLPTNVHVLCDKSRLHIFEESDYEAIAL